MEGIGSIQSVYYFSLANEKNSVPFPKRTVVSRVCLVKESFSVSLELRAWANLPINGAWHSLPFPFNQRRVKVHKPEARRSKAQRATQRHMLSISLSTTE